MTPVVGVTSTPVIDPPATRCSWWRSNPSSEGGASHHLVGLDLHTGKRLLDQVVDPPGTISLTQLQRPGLALDEGRVVIGFGGNDGDCGDYHGWVVSAPESWWGRELFRGRCGAGRATRRGVDGWRFTGGRRVGQCVGLCRERVGDLERGSVRRQRLGARTQSRT